jgi:putative transcriptional regulator
MSKKAFDSIMAGLQDALAYTKGDQTRGRAMAFKGPHLDVGKVRGKVGLSQEEFARAFGVSLGTLRNWEQKRVRPDGPARVLLTVIDRDPVSVLKALRIGPKAAATRRRRAAGAGARSGRHHLSGLRVPAVAPLLVESPRQ